MPKSIMQPGGKLDGSHAVCWVLVAKKTKVLLVVWDKIPHALWVALMEILKITILGGEIRSKATTLGCH